MKRLLALLSAAVLSLGVAACEAPGAPDEPTGVDGGAEPFEDEEAREQDAGDTQLDAGGGPAADPDAEEDHEGHDETEDGEGEGA